MICTFQFFSVTIASFDVCTLTPLKTRPGKLKCMDIKWAKEAYNYNSCPHFPENTNVCMRLISVSVTKEKHSCNGSALQHGIIQAHHACTHEANSNQASKTLRTISSRD